MAEFRTTPASFLNYAPVPLAFGTSGLHGLVKDITDHRIIVGEVRGKEAFDMLQAMNTGHDGSLTTIHANTARDSLMRLETMVAMAKLEIPSEFLRKYIASAIDVVIQVSRLVDGKRKVVSVQEISGMEGKVITMQ